MVRERTSELGGKGKREKSEIPNEITNVINTMHHTPGTGQEIYERFFIVRGINHDVILEVDNFLMVHFILIKFLDKYPDTLMSTLF